MINNDVIMRAFKTFLQAFLAGWALTNFEIEKGALIGAAAAGLSAVTNIAINFKK